MNDKLPLRDRLSLLAALIFVLGGGGLALIIPVLIVESYLPGFGSRRMAFWEILVALPAGVLILFIGMLIGSIFLSICLKPFFKRDELIESVTKPHLPIFSDILLKFIRVLYPKDGT